MPNCKYQIKSRIDNNLHISGNYYKLIFNAARIARVAQPGQFLMLRIPSVPGDYQPLLRRPFGIHSVSNHARCGRVTILYEVVGAGTRLLSAKKRGEALDVLGPLGNGFDLSALSYRTLPILVAGGRGVAPLFFLAQKIINRSSRGGHLRPLVLIGAKTKKEILCKKEFASSGLDVKISSDDGSAGFKGRVTDLLRRLLLKGLLENKRTNRQIIYACGPRPMLKELISIVQKYGLAAQVSLDEYMACGLGVCLGCAVHARDGQKLVCKDGPVFDAAAIHLE
ncbi:dihydroorotate dehydrogenase electron transfer subunit [Candidatus Omnitrophota bacterium]